MSRISVEANEGVLRVRDIPGIGCGFADQCGNARTCETSKAKLHTCRANSSSRHHGGFHESASVHWTRGVAHCGHSDSAGTAVAELHCGDLSDRHRFAGHIRHGWHALEIVVDASPVAAIAWLQGVCAIPYGPTQTHSEIVPS